MRLAGIHQLHYLPWLRYFEKIARSDVFIVLDDIQFNKNGWQNRNKIRTPDGAAVLTVPVLQRFGQRLDEVEIDPHSPWRRKHLRSIEQHYGAAPYFDAHIAFFREVYGRTWDRLNDLNRAMLEYFIGALGIETQIVYSSELRVPGMATERLVQLVQAAGCDGYYSGAYALDAYLDADVLADADIELVLQEWTAPRYAQRYRGFTADLSIIDLLLNCGPQSRGILLGEVLPGTGETLHGEDRGARCAESRSTRAV